MIRRILFLFILFYSSLTLSGQRYEYVYKNSKDSSFNCYLKVFPKTYPVKGLIIRDFSGLPDTAKESPYKFTELCSDNGFMTVFAVSSTQFPELFCEDSVINILDEIVSEVVKKHHIPVSNIFVGGISASGARALRYAQYCEQGKSKNGIKINGVFAVDPPLDLERFYWSACLHKNNFKEGMLWEANHMSKVFTELFGGPPDKFAEKYLNASVFSHSDSLGGNTKYLKNIAIIIYHEPDIDWWLNERGASYFDINSYDIAAFSLKLKLLGNKNSTLITTTGKGFDRNGNRNCHSWTIVNETELMQWIIKQLK